MTDIVERLRLDAEEWATPALVESLRMAADEIERLRRDHDYDAIRWAEVHKEAQAEIERLRQEHEEDDDQNNHLIAELNLLRDFIRESDLQGVFHDWRTSR